MTCSQFVRGLSSVFRQSSCSRSSSKIVNFCSTESWHTINKVDFFQRFIDALRCSLATLYDDALISSVADIINNKSNLDVTFNLLLTNENALFFLNLLLRDGTFCQAQPKPQCSWAELAIKSHSDTNLMKHREWV